MTAAPTIKRTESAPWMHTCCRCGTVRRIEWQHTWRQHRDLYGPARTTDHVWATDADAVRDPWVRDVPVVACACGGRSVGKRITAVIKPGTPCDARCANAKGHVCECSCGGKNHGSGHVGGVS